MTNARFAMMAISITVGLNGGGFMVYLSMGHQSEHIAEASDTDPDPGVDEPIEQGEEVEFAEQGEGEGEEQGEEAVAVSGMRPTPAANPPARRSSRRKTYKRPSRSSSRSSKTVVEPEPPKTAAPDKKQSEARLDIHSVPDGASVKVDGKPRGRAPVVGLMLPANKTYKIKLTHDGHHPFTTELYARPGINPAVIAKLKPVASAAIEPQLVAPAARERDIRVASGTTGSADTGRALFASKCGSCHGSSAKTVKTTHFTKSQWQRFYAYGKHERYGALRPHMSSSQLAHVKAYTMERAADGKRGTVSGVD